MTPGCIVEPLDVVEHIGSGLLPGAVGLALGAFSLQRRRENKSITADTLPSLGSPDVREVGDPLLVWLLGLEQTSRKVPPRDHLHPSAGAGAGALAAPARPADA